MTDDTSESAVKLLADLEYTDRSHMKHKYLPVSGVMLGQLVHGSFRIFNNLLISRTAVSGVFS